MAQGYFNLPEKSEENFSAGADGLRWFATGDIARLLPDGTLMIIDRKKDLVKLPNGEYISLGKVETCLKIHPLVENVCAYVNPMKPGVLAIVVPDALKLRGEAKMTLGLAESDPRALCRCPKVIQHLETVLKEHATSRLERFEVPRALILVPDPWTPDTGLVTAALKIKRRPIEERYKEEIKAAYEAIESNCYKLKMN